MLNISNTMSAEGCCFSLLIPVYSKESSEYLTLCLQSVQDQSLLPAEIVIVLDGDIGTELKGVIKYFTQFLNIKTVGYSKNKGLAFALNYGIANCSYDLIARMDADDICMPLRFEKQISFMMANQHVDICGGYALDIDEYGNELSVRKVPTDPLEIRRLIWSCPIIHPSVIFRKAKILEVGGYDESVPHRQDDYELWIRATRLGLIVTNLNIIVVKYRTYIRSKNNIFVAYNRIKIGIPAVLEFDHRFKAYLALIFPMIRLFLPRKMVSWLRKKYDPRANN